MDPADGSGQRLGAARAPRRLDRETIGIGVVLAALGICCISTLAATGLGIAAIATAGAVAAGLGWLALGLAVVGGLGLGLLRLRRRRRSLASAGPGAIGCLRSGSERAD